MIGKSESLEDEWFLELSGVLYQDIMDTSSVDYDEQVVGCSPSAHLWIYQISIWSIVCFNEWNKWVGR